MEDTSDRTSVYYNTVSDSHIKRDERIEPRNIPPSSGVSLSGSSDNNGGCGGTGGSDSRGVGATPECGESNNTNSDSGNAAHGRKYLVMILSAVGNSDIRNEIRRHGWLRFKWKNNVTKCDVFYRYKFVVGGSNSDDINKEVAKYNDIVVWPGVDSYKHIVHKVVWYMTKAYYDSYYFDYIIKIDDDSFLNLSEMDTKISEECDDAFLYGGRCLINKKVERSGLDIRLIFLYYPV